MSYPDNELAQIVIASCVSNYVNQVVISPGSRNAPLTIGFNENKHTKTYSVVDERCAAFTAMGMAQHNQKASALVCTSGSALLNYYPAVAEAYYSNIPLVIISADRPKNKIDIGDGQTIRQESVFKNHILFEANLTEIKSDIDKVFNQKMIYKALKIAQTQKGPVHINVPFEEPLYNLTSKMLSYPLESLEHNSDPILEVNELEKYATLWNNSIKKMVLVGVHQPSELLQTQIEKLQKDPSVLILTETTSNINKNGVVNSIDQFLENLSEKNKEEIKPEILLSIGGLVVSKRIKQFIRQFKPKEHWAVHSSFGYDTFDCLTKHFKTTTEMFFSQFFWLTTEKESHYQNLGLSIKEKAKQQHLNFCKTAPFTDFKAFESIINTIPKNSILQISNSASIRYAQLFDVDDSLFVFCNRGTSGIDGSTSTAIGYATQTKKQVTLITGDISFLYDSNALWNKNIPNSFRIIILNNNGGGIFKILPGPKKTNALPLFETPHNITAKQLSKMYGFKYSKANSIKKLKNKLQSFYQDNSVPKILEVFTPSDINDTVLQEYFKAFNK